MSKPLDYSMFHEVFFPAGDPDAAKDGGKGDLLTLQKLLSFNPEPSQALTATDFIIFDFETTGLSQQRDEIIEIGGLRYRNGEMKEEFSYLIRPTIPIPDKIAKITGITQDMVKDSPTMAEVLPDFLGFIDGAVLIAHNAEFDMGFFRHALEKNGFQIDWPCFCTLKMTRQLIKELPSYNLDTLASHYNLTNEARHRSVGDCKVTGKVFFNVLAENSAQLTHLASLAPFAVNS